MASRLCREIECAPPFGEKEDCEFWQDGICNAKPLSTAKEARSHRRKLKPCPKCGKNQKRTLPVKNYFETRYKVRCMNCGFETDDFENKEAAQDVWNFC